MLIFFDAKVLNILGRLSNPYRDLVDNDFCTELRGPGALQARRTNALKILSRELRRVYQKPVVVLIDEYDSLMHSAIEHGYGPLVRSFILLLGPLLQLIPHVIPGQQFLYCSIRFVAEGLSASNA
jgi:hypothetical protein